MKKKIALLLATLFLLTVTGCGASSTESKELVIYDGQYSEMKLLHQMVKMVVEQDTDVTVTIKDEMSPVNSFNELVKGKSDLMNCYDGTLLTTFLKLDPEDVPEGKTLYEFANEVAIKEKKVRLLDKQGLDNTYAIAVPQPIADKYQLETVSDLIPVAGELIFGAEHDFFSEEGSMKYSPFVEFYGLQFKNGMAIDLGLKYSAVENGKIDVTVVYATDGLNKKANLKVLEDDRKFFPEYNGAILVREDLFERMKDVAPDLEASINKLGGIFTNEIMVDLTYATDVDGRPVEEVAREFLQSKGLLS